MMRTASPLRYPGGKACLYSLVSDILQVNGMARRHYAEPFAGGCGLALTLLYEGRVSDIHINDIDPGVWAFWHSALEHNDALSELIESTPVTVDEWRRQRSIRSECNAEDPLSLGFATFFLNRTNRSGVIVRAGVVGGLEQSGRYKIDCRFNRETLRHRVRRVAKYRSRIHLSHLDALEFIGHVEANCPARTFLFVDPPYYSKGSRLYTNYYEPADHARLASFLLEAVNPWVVTYDDEPEIKALYRARRQVEFDINYSLQTKRRGTELLVASKGLRLPYELRSGRGG